MEAVSQYWRPVNTEEDIIDAFKVHIYFYFSIYDFIPVLDTLAVLFQYYPLLMRKCSSLGQPMMGYYVTSLIYLLT